MSFTALRHHPYADVFPMASSEDFERLAEDIGRTHGPIEPIVLFDGMILDGRNRHRACINGCVELKAAHFVEFEGDEEAALAFVISKNLARRHLSGPQCDAVAAEIANLKTGSQPGNQKAAKNKSPKLDSSPPEQHISLSEAAAAMGRSRASVAKARAVKEKAPEVFEALKGGKINTNTAVKIASLPEKARRRVLEDAKPAVAVKKQARAVKERALAAKQVDLPQKRYGVILADPEWRFEVYSENGMDRSADNHYPTSTTEEIAARGVADIAADDCALFLWATVPMLPDALRVMQAWGFTYKSHFVWVKDRCGNGYWNRNRHELILIGTRGAIPCPAPGDQWESVIFAPVGAHSRKPDQFMKMIESYFPNLPKIELNCRGKPRDGWEGWGNEAVELGGEVA